MNVQARSDSETTAPQGADMKLEMSRIFEKQSARALKLRSSSARQRAAKLRLLLDTVLKYREDILKAAYDDFRKPAAEAELTEIFPVVAEARHTIRHLNKWMKPRRVNPTMSMLGTRSHVRFEPMGVCLIISPWNYPVTLTLSPLISAIAAGNTAIVKPSEMTPAMAGVMRKIIEEVFDEDEVAVFEGDYRVSQQLLEMPFNHIFFTGSPAVGKIVMTAAAKHLASVTLELGGKSPAIIDKTANLKTAARNVVWGKFCNNGQTCIAPDYLVVHADVRDAFLEEVGHAINRAYGDSAEKRMQSPDYCRIVNRRHFDRLKNLFDDAVEKGARILVGGTFNADQLFVEPTLVDNVADDSEIMEEEIFGPLLPVLTYTDITNVVDTINQKHKPLALYVYSTNKQTTDYVLDNTSAGGSCVNHSLVQYMHQNVPFGGANNSGIGSSTGFAGFKAFSHERSVVADKFSVTHWMQPPYTDKVKRLIRMSVDRLT